MTTDEAVKYLSALAESEWRFLSDGRGHALKPIRVVLAELATLRENAGRLMNLHAAGTLAADARLG